MVMSEIDQCLSRDISLGEISTSDVTIAVASGPNWSANIEYF